MRTMAITILIAALSAASAALPAAATWSQWGGPARNFTVDEPAAAGAWSSGSPKLLWQRRLGPGYSAIVGDGERLYTMTRRAAEEVIVALAPESGETVWEHAYPAPIEGGESLDTTWGSGPNGTPLLVAGRLYALGFTGVVSCLDTASGELVWRRDLDSELGLPPPYFGYSASPLRYGETVIVTAGEGGALALRLDDGATVWQSDGFTGSYASPTIWRVGPRDQLVVPAAGELVGLDPRDGTLRWRHEHANNPRTILSGAVLGDDRLLFASVYFLGAIGLQLAEDGGSVTELWDNPRLQLSHVNSIRVGDLVYGFHRQVLTALEVTSGEVVWRSRDVERGNLLWVGDRFLILDRYGTLHLASLGPEGATVHARAQILEGRSWTAPTLIGSRLYARNLESIVAVDLAQPGEPAATGSSGPARRAPTLPAEFLAAAEGLIGAFRAGDSEALASAAARIGRWAEDAETGSLARYYQGLAAWQRGLQAGRLGLGLLREAEGHLNEAIRRQPDLVDAHLVLSRLIPMYYRLDPGRAAVVGPMADEHLAEALRYAPRDPRVMAIQGLDMVYSPPEYGGDPAAGLALVRRALDRFASEPAADPYPNWGAASVWAWYGSALLRAVPEDNEAAQAAFRAALELAPDLAAARRQLEE